MWGRNPVFDETIEFSIAEEHLAKRSLSATVKIKSKRSMYNKVIGQVCIGRNLSFKVSIHYICFEDSIYVCFIWGSHTAMLAYK